jgi:(p)ppGpp synthase/HD superfamily hydrolase
VVHASQTRKGSAIPYLSHLMGVASLVLEHGGDMAIPAHLPLRINSD